MSAEQTTKREAIGKRVRFEVFKRDGFKCMYCGAHPPNALLECDHVEPVSLGGTNDESNLITACQACNRGKSNIRLSDVPMSLSERAAIVSEMESQIAGYESVMRERRERIEADAEEVLNVWCERHKCDGMSFKDFDSIKNFVTRLGLDEVMTSLAIACARKPYSKSQCFKYFCGVCWTKIRDREGTR